jgi:hypothetical protein
VADRGIAQRVGIAFACSHRHIAGSFIYDDGPSAMLGGMFAGMVWGMVVSMALHRLYVSLRRNPAIPA